MGRAFYTLASIVWVANTIDGHVLTTNQPTNGSHRPPQTMRPRELWAKFGDLGSGPSWPGRRDFGQVVNYLGFRLLTGNMMVMVTGQCMAQRRREDGM